MSLEVYWTYALNALIKVPCACLWYILCVICKSLGVKGSQSAFLYSLGGSYPFYLCTISITEIISFIYMYNISYLKLTLLNSILNLWSGPLRFNWWISFATVFSYIYC